MLKLVSLVGACMLLLVGYKEEYPTNYSIADQVLSVAHRGASAYAPENTRAAFRKGVELGADLLELDVHLSKDGELIIIHDEKIDRTTNGQGFVSDFILTELKELDAGGKFHEDFTGEQLLTLDEVMDEFYGQIGLLIEIKKPFLNRGIEEKVVAVLRQYTDLSSIVVQSFDVESLKKIHKLLPELQIAVLMKPSVFLPSSKKIQDLASFATYINFNISYVNERIVSEVHRYGGKVFVWSVKDRKSADKAIQYGVDGMITDTLEWPIENVLYVVNE